MQESSRPADADAAADASPLFCLTNVEKTYLDGNVDALQSVSLDIYTGEFVSIMGPSGCGKSTLLNILGGLDQPTQGTIHFQGRPLGSGTTLDRFRADSIGFVFQAFYLLPNLTALENVQIPMFVGKLPLAERVTRAKELLALVGLETRMTHLPHQLSIGQRQRVAVARALANQPSVILADEPTGSLDSHSGSEVLELLGHLNRTHGTTLIVVTHDQSIAQRAARLVSLLDGKIVDDSRI